MIATACTIETIIEDPLLPILKEDSNVTKPAGQIRRPGLGHNSTSPRFKLLMKNLVPDTEVGVFLVTLLFGRRKFYAPLREVFHL